MPDKLNTTEEPLFPYWQRLLAGVAFLYMAAVAAASVIAYNFFGVEMGDVWFPAMGALILAVCIGAGIGLVAGAINPKT